ncbi:hypothetical protein QR680_004399 [Steinernema hermaphroditum]|uniref:Uncharacterized protein n=1 Tax=Steinernema hermaphroditum TaxID=289476 RepID=A0AA39HPP1_9BILA|nr:hypothetical protein QR680_004399 [Steinernema hermaphroditum]
MAFQVTPPPKGRPMAENIPMVPLSSAMRSSPSLIDEDVESQRMKGEINLSIEEKEGSKGYVKFAAIMMGIIYGLLFLIYCLQILNDIPGRLIIP